MDSNNNETMPVSSKKTILQILAEEVSKSIEETSKGLEALVKANQELQAQTPNSAAHAEYTRLVEQYQGDEQKRHQRLQALFAAMTQGEDDNYVRLLGLIEEDGVEKTREERLQALYATLRHRHVKRDDPPTGTPEPALTPASSCDSSPAATTPSTETSAESILEAVLGDEERSREASHSTLRAFRGFSENPLPTPTGTPNRLRTPASSRGSSPGTTTSAMETIAARSPDSTTPTMETSVSKSESRKLFDVYMAAPVAFSDGQQEQMTPPILIKEGIEAVDGLVQIGDCTALLSSGVVTVHTTMDPDGQVFSDTFSELVGVTRIAAGPNQLVTFCGDMVHWFEYEGDGHFKKKASLELSDPDLAATAVNFSTADVMMVAAANKGKVAYLSCNASGGGFSQEVWDFNELYKGKKTNVAAMAASKDGFCVAVEIVGDEVAIGEEDSGETGTGLGDPEDDVKIGATANAEAVTDAN